MSENTVQSNGGRECGNTFVGKPVLTTIVIAPVASPVHIKAP